MQKGLISIVIPAFNAEKYVERCLSSLLKQSYSHLEILIVDDGSADRTAEIVRSYDDKRVRLLVQPCNKGQSAARNKGLRHINGQFTAFVDVDDYVDEDFYEKMVSALLQNNADVALGETRLIEGEKSTLLQNLPETVEDYVKKIQLLHHSGPCDKLYRSEIIKKKNLWFEEGRMYEDSLFVAQYLFYAGKMAVMSGPAYNYIIYGNSTSHSSEKTLKRFNDSLFIAEKIMAFAATQKMSKSEKETLALWIRANLTPPECAGQAEYQRRQVEILG